MKITRKGHKIIFEIEAGDCEPGNTLEMQADLFFAGINVGRNDPAAIQIGREMKEKIARDTGVAEKLQKVHEDFKERWEL